MKSAELESIIREIADENGTAIEEFDCTANPDGGWDIAMKADGNPFSNEDFGEDEGQELLVSLRGRECQYHSTRLGSAPFEEWQIGQGIPEGWRAEWTSNVSAWDEYTDTPDTHRISAWIGPECSSTKPRTQMRAEFEQNLVGELAGDLFLVTSRLRHLTLPLPEHQKQSIKDYAATLMRSIACL